MNNQRTTWSNFHVQLQLWVAISIAFKSLHFCSPARTPPILEQLHVSSWRSKSLLPCEPAIFITSHGYSATNKEKNLLLIYVTSVKGVFKMGIHSKFSFKFLVSLSLLVNGIFLVRMLLSHSERENVKLVSVNSLEPPRVSQRMSAPGKLIHTDTDLRLISINMYTHMYMSSWSGWIDMCIRWR